MGSRLRICVICCSDHVNMSSCNINSVIRVSVNHKYVERNVNVHMVVTGV